MIVPAFSQGLYGRLRQLAAADWQRYVAHPFVQQLASGTLAENAFRRYLIQDYLFLIHFARSYALLVSKLRTLPEMRAAAASMNAILNELPLHVGYCAQWGISEPEMAAQPEAPETLNYTRYVLDIGHSGDALDLLVALMPCVAGYAEIGLGLLQHPATRLDDNPYASWIRNYGDEGYLQGVSAALALLETVWQQRGSEARITELSEIFTTATRLEAQFWQMGLNAAAETGRDGAGYRGPWPEPACRRPSAVRQPVVYGPRRAVGVAARRQRRRQNQPAAGDGRSGARHLRRSGRQRWATDSGPSGVDGAERSALPLAER
ncbi:thiaminase [Klebsiella pneumoniae UHKPC45]|nr:thiaminase [Klebsiella pneumoniae UHKPC45]